MTLRPINVFKNQVLITEGPRNDESYEEIFPSVFRRTITRATFGLVNAISIFRDYMHPTRTSCILCPEKWLKWIQLAYKNYFSRNKSFKVVLTQSILQDILTEEGQDQIIEETHDRAHRGIEDNYKVISGKYFFPRMRNKLICASIIIYSIIPYTLADSFLNVINIGNNPIVEIKITNCKIQTGNIKIIHPVKLDRIEESMEIITNSFYNKLTNTNNPLHEVIKFRIKKLYATLYGLKPQQARRHRRWDSLGTAWKWIAGSPDAQDLHIINSTMNELINQNNHQYKINDNINNRITQLTITVNQIANSLNSKNKANLDALDAVTTMLNVDVINELLDNIQEAITLSKISISNNKILSTREINIIKSTLQDQGVLIHFPDEALQFVTPKVAVRNGDLLYILNVPQLESTTSTITRIYPLIVDNQIIRSYPSHIIRHGNKLFTTRNPEDFVQKSTFITEFEDDCIQAIIFGKQSRCSSIFQNETTQQLVNENTLLISNAVNHTLETNCGPDTRRITGNFIIKFNNCTVNFNGQSFRSSETFIDTEVINNAFHNSLMEWSLHKPHDIAEISNTAVSNRQKLDHVYLQQDSLHFKLWTTFGGISISTILGFCGICIIIKVIVKNITNGPGRSVLEEGSVIVASHQPNKPNIVNDQNSQHHQVRNLQRQQVELEKELQRLRAHFYEEQSTAPQPDTTTRHHNAIQ
nr:uncharacterized protein LOC115267933 isoform X1 [Aedes albopictus]